MRSSSLGKWIHRK